MRNNSVRAKKHLGQHFLKDDSISHRIVNSLTGHGDYKQVLEIGPGTGALTREVSPTRRERVGRKRHQKESSRQRPA